MTSALNSGIPIAGQQWNPGHYSADAGFVPVLGNAVAALLAPRRGERILDLGCGDGVLTAKLAESGAMIVGVDASPELVATAAAHGLDARVMDGHALDFDNEFDAVFSNAALHWMRRPDEVIAGVRHALKPGGRFVGEFGGHGNVAAIVTALLASLEAQGIEPASRFRWFFPTPSEYQARLERHGFTVTSIALIPRPTPLPTGMSGWLRSFASPFLAGLAAPVQQAVLDETVSLLQHSLRDESGQWAADYVRLRFSAHL